MSIEIERPSCNQRYESPDRHAGKEIKCPVCGGAICVPPITTRLKVEQEERPQTGHGAADAGTIEIQCPDCGQCYASPARHAGKTINCPECDAPIQVPAIESKGKKEGTGQTSDSEELQFAPMTVGVRCKCGRELHAKEEDAGRNIRCPDCGAEYQLPKTPGEFLPNPMSIEEHRKLSRRLDAVKAELKSVSDAYSNLMWLWAGLILIGGVTVAVMVPLLVVLLANAPPDNRFGALFWALGPAGLVGGMAAAGFREKYLQRRENKLKQAIHTISVKWNLESAALFNIALDHTGLHPTSRHELLSCIDRKMYLKIESAKSLYAKARELLWQDGHLSEIVDCLDGFLEKVHFLEERDAPSGGRSPERIARLRLEHIARLWLAVCYVLAAEKTKVVGGRYKLSMDDGVYDSETLEETLFWQGWASVARDLALEAMAADATCAALARDIISRANRASAVSLDEAQRAPGFRDRRFNVNEIGPCPETGLNATGLRTADLIDYVRRLHDGSILLKAFTVSQS